MLGKYDTPSHVSKEARYLLCGMLNINPTKRMSISEIRASEFYT
jgi:hypothetical protein